MKASASVFVMVGLFCATESYAQTSSFGTKWPSLEECLEFSEETGVWICRTKQSGEFVIRLDKNGEFEMAWKETTKTTNKFGRVVLNNEQFNRLGNWRVELRSPSVAEATVLIANSKNKRSSPSSIKIHFLTLEFKNNDESKRTRHESQSKGKINGSCTFALYEHPIKPGDSVSSPTSLLWIQADASEGFDFQFFDADHLKDTNDVWLYTWTHD